MQNPMDSIVLEAGRLATFTSWPYGDNVNCSKEKMAEAGFYKKYPELDDSAACFVCGKELDGWDEGDDPWQEHIKHAPYCKFIQLRKPEADLTLKEYIEFVYEAKTLLVKKKQEENEDLLIRGSKSLKEQLEST